MGNVGTRYWGNKIKKDDISGTAASILILPVVSIQRWRKIPYDTKQKEAAVQCKERFWERQIILSSLAKIWTNVFPHQTESSYVNRQCGLHFEEQKHEESHQYEMDKNI